MRQFFTFLLFFVLGAAANAGILQSAKLDASVASFATTYTLVGTHNVSVPLGAAAGTLCWYNGTGALMALYVDNDLAAAAPSADVQDIYVPAGESKCLPQNTRLTRTIQVRSASGSTVSAGVFYLYITDKRG